MTAGNVKPPTVRRRIESSDISQKIGGNWSNLLEAIPDTVIVSDAHGRIIFVNTAVKRFFGFLPEQLIGQNVEVLVPQKARSSHLAHRTAYAAHPKFHSVGERSELRAVRADGSEFPVAISLGYTELDQGEFIVIAIVEDITERIRADKSKDEFIATVAHELRTPITSMSGSLALLAAGAADDVAPNLLQIAHKNCQRLIHLTDAILDVVRIESGELHFEAGPVDLYPLVERAIQHNIPYAENLKVQLTLDSSAKHASARAAPSRLAQVVTILISNAIKFSPAHTQVLISIDESGGEILISVRDHGPGVPDEYKRRIFEKFVQVNAQDAKESYGFGLGLHIAKKIVERHHGKVWVEDAPDGGAVFYCTIPSWNDAIEANDNPTADKPRSAIL